MSTCKNVVVGIDCGTLNTKVAIYDGRNDAVTRTVPSDIWFSPEIHVGQNASVGRKNIISGYLQVLGRTAEDPSVVDLLRRKDSYLTNDGNTLKYKLSLKGEERKLRPELVLALFLDKATTEDDVRDAVLTVPAHFTQSQRLALLDAAKVSKLNVRRLLCKSTAVAIAYFVKNAPVKSRNVLVYHLDSTSFEVAVVHCKDNVVDVKYCRGLNKYGGLYVNRLIYEDVKGQINDPKFTMDGNLVRKIEAAKRQLLDSQEGIIELPKYDDFEYSLTRQAFDKLLEKEVVAPTMGHVNDALRSCGLSRGDISDVILSGGHCKASAVKERLARDFHIYKSSDCTAAVGAAHFCANLTRHEFEVREPVELHVRQQSTATSRCVEFTPRGEAEAQIRVECSIDNNGLCKVTIQQPMALCDAEIDELRFEKEALLRQNVELHLSINIYCSFKSQTFLLK